MTNMLGLISSDMHSHSLYWQFGLCAVYFELLVRSSSGAGSKQKIDDFPYW